MKRYGLIGYPLTHSFSKKYFQSKFMALGITDCAYDLFEFQQVEEVVPFIEAHQDLYGLSVTLPFKTSIMPFLQAISPEATLIGAVNCIKIQRHTPGGGYVLKGFNTDAYGFEMSIKPLLKSCHQRALVLGTGGASKAVAFVLRKIGIDCYFVTRTPVNKAFHFTYAELSDIAIKHFKLIVNTTPVGMFPHVDGFPQIPFEPIGQEHLLIDLIYNPSETQFLRFGKQRGATILNGQQMLAMQADRAWEIFNDPAL